MCVCVYVCVCVCVILYCVPSQMVPSPVKPSGQIHLKPSSRSMHSAIGSQLSKSSAHSSTAAHTEHSVTHHTESIVSHITQ